MTRILWTEEEEGILRKLSDKKVLPSVMAKAMGRTENAIRAKLKHLGIEVPSEKAELDYEMIQKLLEPEEI